MQKFLMILSGILALEICFFIGVYAEFLTGIMMFVTFLSLPISIFLIPYFMTKRLASGYSRFLMGEYLLWVFLSGFVTLISLALDPRSGYLFPVGLGFWLCLQTYFVSKRIMSGEKRKFSGGVLYRYRWQVLYLALMLPMIGTGGIWGAVALSCKPDFDGYTMPGGMIIRDNSLLPCGGEFAGNFIVTNWWLPVYANRGSYWEANSYITEVWLAHSLPVD